MGLFAKLFGKDGGGKADAPAAAPPLEEIIFAAGQSLWRVYPSDGISPSKLKRILRDADVGQTFEFMELLDDVSADAQVSTALSTRKLAVAGANWNMDAADDPERADLARAISDDAEAFVKRIGECRQLFVDLMDAHYRGFAANQPLWEPAIINGKPRFEIPRHKALESRFFRFDTDLNPLIMTERNLGGEPLPPGVLFHTSRDKPGPIVRGGTGRSIVKPWLYKGLNLVDCASYLERFGHPLVVAKYKQSIREGSAEYEAAKRAARALIADMVAMVPENASLELLGDLNKADNIDRVYLAFIKFCDEQINKAEGLGAQTMDAGPGGMGHGQEQKGQGDVRQDLKQLDAVRLEDTLQCGLLKPFVLYHYGPEAVSLTPRLCFDVDRPEDQVAKTTAQKNRADTFVVLRNGGAKITMAQVNREFDIDEAEGDEPLFEAPKVPTIPPPGVPLGTAAPAPGAPPPSQAARASLSAHASGAAAGQDYVDRLRADVQARAADAISVDLAAVLEEIAAAKDPDDLRARLTARFAAMDPSALAEVTRKARILAELAGRKAVLDDL
jgi:phage gp29-like protein